MTADRTSAHGTIARAIQHHDEGDRLCADCLTAERDYAFVEWKRMRAIADDLRDDRDRARSIAVALEQENAELMAELARYCREATVLHSVVEQAGLLVEHIATTGYGGIALTLRQILDGATFEEVRGG